MGYRDFPCSVHTPYVDALHDALHAEPVEAIDHRQLHVDHHSDQLRAAIARSQFVATEEDGKQRTTLAAERLPSYCDYPDTELTWRLLMQITANTKDRMGIGDVAISLFEQTLEHAAEEMADIEARGGRVIYGAKA